jgi:hypothetical protein
MAYFAKQMTKNRVKGIIEKRKWEMIMTHTSRRSFCTNMYLRGVPNPTIMAISGHKTEKNFMKYIKATGVEHADIMRKYWDQTTDKIQKNDQTDGINNK